MHGVKKRYQPTQLLGFFFLLFVLPVLLVFVRHQQRYREQAAGTMTNHTYTQSTANFTNPERGYAEAEIDDAGTDGHFGIMSYSTFRTHYDNGQSIVKRDYVIGNLRDQALPQAFLDDLTSEFANARQAGVKLFPVFAYCWSDTCSDATKDRILQHISQLKPVLQANKDVIVFMNAGFIGYWGEWHDSKNGLTNSGDYAGRSEILHALLDAVGPDRQVLIRYPVDKRAIFNRMTPIQASEAFDGSDYSRVGHHDDCWLASPDDYGTYANGFGTQWWMSIDNDRAYLHDDNQYVFQGGEGCDGYAGGSLLSFDNANADTSYLHISQMNVTQAMKDTWGQANQDYIYSHLGYRIRMTTSSIQQNVKPGGQFDMTVTMINDGYARIMNMRPWEIIIRNLSSGAAYVLPVSDDIRMLGAGETKTYNISGGVPSTIPSGQYAVFMNFPDAYASLYKRPEYSIQLANTNVWESSTGYNSLQHILTIDTSVGGADYTGSILFQPIGSGPVPTSGQPTVSPSIATGPWLTPVSMPGKVEAENYMAGGEGVGYHDVDGVNQLGAYRQDGVDIETCTDGSPCYSIGYVNPSEWLAYSITVPIAGQYAVSLRAATAQDGQSAHLELDGNTIGATITVPNTNDYVSFTNTLPITISLPSGNHTLKLVFDGVFTLNYLTISQNAISPTATQTPAPSITTTMTPVPATRLSLVLKLHGIGTGGDNVTMTSVGNTSPITTTRAVTLDLYNSSNQLIGQPSGVVTYRVATGDFAGIVDVGSIASGPYTVIVHTGKYLPKQIFGIQTITASQTTAVPSTTLVVGDSNGDGALSILDYNILLDCYSELLPAKNCSDSSKKVSADLQDDGNVNSFDYNLFLRELSVQR